MRLFALIAAIFTYAIWADLSHANSSLQEDMETILSEEQLVGVKAEEEKAKVTENKCSVIVPVNKATWDTRFTSFELQ